MADRNKGFRRGDPEISITFHDFVRGFCNHAETKINFVCPECMQQTKCNNAFMQDNLDVIGLFKCRCGHLFRESVKADELRRQFGKITDRDTRQYDSTGAMVAELKDLRKRMYAEQECCA